MTGGPGEAVVRPPAGEPYLSCIEPEAETEMLEDGLLARPAQGQWHGPSQVVRPPALHTVVEGEKGGETRPHGAVALEVDADHAWSTGGHGEVPRVGQSDADRRLTKGFPLRSPLRTVSARMCRALTCRCACAACQDWTASSAASLPAIRSSRRTDARGPCERCACRKAHPPSSGGMSVLVEDAAESLASSYAEVGDLLRIADRHR